MSDMKCPFCQQKMRRTNGTHNKVGVWQCQNSNDPDNVCIASGYLFNDDVLNYINRTRKALDVAVDKLKGIKWYYDDSYADPNFVNWYIVAQRLANDADDTIKNIEQIKEQQ